VDIIIATRNRKKIEEIKRIIGEKILKDLSKPFQLRIFTLNDFPECPEVVEDERTFEANAIKKAVSVARYTGMTALADDSGLEVYALNGEPGIQSSRYAGVGADDRENLERLLYEMHSLDNDKRGARFVCCIAIATPDGSIITFLGYAEGKIGKEPKGISGFGYDPVFYPEGYTKTFAEMTDAEKDAISHRGKALRKLYQYIREKEGLS
jgi:XTP/dITP diphosphohydrolase